MNVPSEIKTESLIKKFERWVQNQSVNADIFFLPFVMEILSIVSLDTYYIVFDASLVGRHCISLMASFVYKGRAIPLTWITVNGKKGHLPEELHIQLLSQVKEHLLENVDVVVLGDGEFDGIDFLHTIEEYQWQYVVRTARNSILVTADDEQINFNELTPSRGKSIIEREIRFTNKKYDIESAVISWRKDCKEPIYLISNIDSKVEILSLYKKRFTIETLFSDKKSRGFGLDKSHLSIISRINSLLIATSIAYIWIIFLGVYCVDSKLCETIHRKTRCDLSLFQLGYRLLEFLLANSKIIPIGIIS